MPCIHRRAAAAITALTLAACRSGEPARSASNGSASTSSSQRSNEAAPAINVVTVTARDFSFDAPAEIPAGLTTFRLVNEGPSLHHIQLIKLEAGKTTDDYLAALKAGGPPPRWATPAGGPNPPEPGDTTNTTIEMTAGNYAMLCLIPSSDGAPHITKGMVRPLRVTESSRPAAAEPSADVVIQLLDFDFHLSQPLTAGRHTIRVENHGAQPHEMAIVRLEPGKSPMDFAKWGERLVGPAPGKLYGGVTGIMPGTHAFVTADLPAGEYALICFVPDMKDGKPHFAHGMAKQVKVS